MARRSPTTEGLFDFEAIAALALVLVAAGLTLARSLDYWPAALLVGGLGVVAVIYLSWTRARSFGRLNEELERLAQKDLAESVDEAFGSGSERACRRNMEQIRISLRSTEDVAGSADADFRDFQEKAARIAADIKEGAREQLAAIDETASAMAEMNQTLKSLSDNVDTLAQNAEESSSSILEMAAANDEVAENMFTLAASVEQTTSALEQMTDSIKNVAKNVDELASTAEETSASMNEIDISIRQVENFADESAKLSSSVTKSAQSGVEAIQQTLDGINRIKDSSSDTVQIMTSLGDKISEIGKILTVIDDVSEQTNLLALNAAIIAAQAGEHGKGFAVVADEIKDLAERSAASTKEIAELIRAVQQESQLAIKAVEDAAVTVDEGVRVSYKAENALQVILESAQRSTEMVDQIAKATVEQAQGTNRVAEATTSTAERVQSMAVALGEHARGSEQIMQSAEKMRSITQHVERSSQEQTRGSQQVTRAIENITQMINRLNVAQKEQSKGGDQILTAVERLSSLASKQDELADTLGNLASEIGDERERVQQISRSTRG
jgi:methyl-accepting chemotaxis protein